MNEQLYSDAARRLSDTVSQHIADHGVAAFRQWIAARLSDGGTDGVLYALKREAIAHQLDETQCAYVQIVPGGMPVRDAEAFLIVNRKLYDAGFRIIDPDRDVHIPWQLGDAVLHQRLIVPRNREQRRRIARQIKRGGRR